jgi:pre-rRNA-processing protein RIX1
MARMRGSGMLNREQRPEPPSTALMLIRTLTRVFTVLTHERPTLTRELVTPHLPVFFTALIAATEGEGAAWEALRDVVAAHPVTFRPFVNKARAAVLKLLASGTAPEDVERNARALWVTLCLCASGKGSGSSGGKAGAVTAEWKGLFEATIAELHAALDAVLQPVTEDYDYRHSAPNTSATTGLEPAAEGVAPQTERALLLLRMLGSFFTTSMTVQPSIPVLQLIDAASRIFAVTAASATPNPAVERAVRESLFSLLPTLHKATLDLLDTLSRRLQSALLPFVPALLEQAAYIVSETPTSADVKVAAYTLTTTLLSLAGPALGKATVASIHPTISSACDDLLPRPRVPVVAGAGKKGGKTTHADSFLSSTTAALFAPSGLPDAAGKLLASALAKLPPLHTRAELRAKMERTAVLTGNKDALLAAVLFPRPAARVGLLPHLVAAGVDVATEGLVKPRLPVVWTGPTKEELRRQMEEEREEREMEEEAEEEVEERAHKRARTSSPPPPPQPTMVNTASFFAQPPPTLAPTTSVLKEDGVSPEKPYPALPVRAASFSGREGLEYPSLSQTQTTMAAGVSPVKFGTEVVGERSFTVGGGSVTVTERKAVAVTIEEDSDEDMEIPEIDMGGSDDDSDDE